MVVVFGGLSTRFCLDYHSVAHVQIHQGLSVSSCSYPMEADNGVMCRLRCGSKVP